jgi:4-amino-4-deoxy-L-arabinose transferase-like glycosyltransferase
MRVRNPTPLLVILGLALVVRLGVIVATPHFTPIFDAADFHRHATSIAGGHGYPAPQLGLHGPTAFRTPGYPVALAVVQKLGGGWTAERVLGALLGVLTVLLIYVLARTLWGARVAVLAGAIAAIFPPLVVLNVSLLSEVLFLPLMLAAVLAVLEYRESQSLRWAAAAGVLCGLSALTRPNGLVLVLALAAGAWTLRPRFSRTGVLAPAVVVLATVVTISPWVIRNAIEFHRFVGLGTGAGYALAGTYNGEARARGDHPGQPFAPNSLRTFRDIFVRRDLDEAQFTGRLNDRAVDYIKAHPGYVVEAMAWNILRVLDIERADSFERAFAAQEVQAQHVDAVDSPIVFLGSLYAVLLLAVLGVVVLAGRVQTRTAPWFVWLVPLFMVLPALAIYGLPRYRAPVDPFLVMLAGLGAVATFDWFRLGAAARSRRPLR